VAHKDFEVFSGERPEMPPSLWAATAIAAPPISQLQGAVSADVTVIGAGYMGLTAALHLAEGGLRVIVLDAVEPGWGASGRNNGQVIPGLKLDPDELEERLGKDIGRRVSRWAGEGPSRVFELIDRNGIDCNPVRKGWIQPAYGQGALPLIASRVRQWEERGAPVSMLCAEELAYRLGTPKFAGGWIDHRGGSIHPLNYARGLAKTAIAAGAIIHSRSPVLKLERKHVADSRWVAITPTGIATSSHVIVATNGYGWERELVPGIRRSFVSVRTAQVATRPLDPKALEAILPDRQVASDTRRLLTSFRISPDGRLVMGGAGATAGIADDHLADRLHSEASDIFGHLTPLEWDFQWSGYFAVTADHLPHLYEPAPALSIGLGCNGRGIAVATSMGILLAERTLGNKQPEELDLPITMPSNYPLHRFRKLGVALATHIKRTQDHLCT
jgi:glycine/D-amino acid oxidase-like deaminating enzyme